MLRTTVVGSWPPHPRFHARLASYRRGGLSADAAEALLTETAACAIAQQRVCGLVSYTGGETAADSFILHFPRWLIGIAPTERTDAWGGRGTYRIVDTLDAPHGLGIAAAFRRERAIDPALPKVTIPGPSEITMILEPREERERALPRAIELIRAEIAQLVALGAKEIQLDVTTLNAHPLSWPDVVLTGDRQGDRDGSGGAIHRRMTRDGDRARFGHD